MQKGDTVPDFTLPDQTGTDRTLSELLANGPVVLFFYPGAMTYGCTKESCHFRDLKAEFAAVGAQPVGISADPVGQAEAVRREGVARHAAALRPRPHRRLRSSAPSATSARSRRSG